MTGTELAIIFATLAGPVLAVQAQKLVELTREKRQRKVQIFNILMATRAARMTNEHVQALNMIEMTFYGRRFLGARRQTQSERAVVGAWHSYFSSLLTDESQVPDMARREENFTSLLIAIANDLGYEFDRMQITKSAYSPVGAWEEQKANEALRSSLTAVFSGERALKMDIKHFPFDEALSASTVNLQTKVADASSDGALIVRRQPEL